MIGLIARRELFAHLHSFSFWLIAFAAHLLTGWLLFAQLQAYEQVAPQLAAAQSTLGIHDLVIDPTLNTLSLLILLFAPLLSMQSIVSERREQRLQSLLASDIKVRELVLGKALGNLLAACIIVLAGFSSLLWLQLGIGLHIASLSIALLTLLLLTLFSTTLSVLASSVSQSAGGALAASYGVLILLWLLDGLIEPDSSLRLLALNDYLSEGLSGRLSANTLVLLLGGSIVFSLISTLHVAHERTRCGLQGWRRLLNALLLAGLLGAGLSLTQRQAPLLSADTPTSPALLEALDAIEGPLVITAYAPELPLLRAQIQKQLAPLLQHHAETRLQFIDPLQQPQLARDQGVSQHGELVIEAMHRREQVPQPSQATLLAALNRLALKSEPWILFVQGNGEADVSDTGPQGISGWVAALAGQGFKPIALPFSSLQQIPENVASIVIAGPQSDYPAATMQAIERYVRAGGGLLWLHEGKAKDRLQGFAQSQEAHPGASTARGKQAPFAPHRVQFAGSTALTPKAASTSQMQAVSDNSGDTFLVALAQQQGQGHTLVIGDSDFARNSLLAKADNRAFALQLVHWLSGNQLATAQVADDLQMHWSQAEATLAAAANLIILPLLWLLIGVWIRRARMRSG